MKNIKKLIIILAILIVIIIVALIIILQNKDAINNAIEENNYILDEASKSNELEKNIVLETNDSTFFSVESNLKNYILYLKVKNSKALYELYSQEYINKNQITQENILNKVDKIETDSYEFKLKKLYLNESYMYTVYYAEGILLQDGNETNKYFIVYVDQETLSWALEPITENEYKAIINGTKKDEQNKITRTQYNKFMQSVVNEEDLARKYFEDYVYYAVHNIQKSYDMLDKEYKSKKYENISKYQQYLNNKKEQLTSMDRYSIKKQTDFATEEQYNEYLNDLTVKGLKEYSIKKEANYTQCICIDDYGSYYIFRITSPMQYTVILDTYSIDLPEFTATYQKSTETEKVLLNIQKFFDAINNKDYEYAYSKLDETYRNNNFKTLADFEKYAKENFYEQNKLLASTPVKQGTDYIWNVTILDANDRLSSSSITRSFVMRLGEGTDFIMSFGLQ